MKYVVLSMVMLTFGTSTLLAQVTYNLVFSGAAEVPGPGDPDGVGTGTITFYPNDPGSPTYGSYSYNITFQNVAQPLGDAHIHTGAVGVQGPPHIAMGVGTLAGEGPGTFIKSWNDANWPTHQHWLKPQLQAVVNNPAGFYMNLHNSAFPGGAIRAQLPEPTFMAPLLVGGLALLRRRHAA